MTSRVVLVVAALLGGAILGLESLGRIIGSLPRVAGWQAVIVIVLILVGVWSLDRLLQALVVLTGRLLRPADRRAGRRRAQLQIDGGTEMTLISRGKRYETRIDQETRPERT